MKLAIAFLLASVLLASNGYALSLTEGTSAPASGSQYSPSAEYSFYVTADVEPSTVYFESNFQGSMSNATVTGTGTYFFNITSIPYGNYLYRWFAYNGTEWTSTGQKAYGVAKNSTSVMLYLDGVEGNRTYLLGTIANVTAYFDVSSFNISSNHSGIVNGTYGPSITFSPNVTSPGAYYVTASWAGNANYTNSSKTFYMGDSLPTYSGISANPSSGTTYNSGSTYTFSITWSTCNNITGAWFESNHTGTLANYTAPNVTNSSGVYTISISNLPARIFTYRWIARDIIGRYNATGQNIYSVTKGTPLSLQVTPSVNVTEGENITVRCILTNSQMGVSDFKLYRDSTEISNDTYYSRKDSQTLSVGTYVYVCNTTGTQNYTNQSVNYTVRVLSNQTPERAFGIEGESTVSLQPGGSGEYAFRINNTMGYTLSNLSAYVNGLDTNWYTIGDIASSILDNTTIQGRITFNIPQAASAGSYSFTLRVTGKTLSGQTNETSKSIVLELTAPEQQSYPPTYSADDADSTVNGNVYEFALKWVDDVGLAGYIFSSNATGVWANDTLVPISGTEGWSYASKDISPGTAVAWKFYMEDSDGAWSSSETFILGSAAPGMDFVPIIVIVVIAAGVAVAFLLISQKKPGVKKEKVEYVYERNDAV